MRQLLAGIRSLDGLAGLVDHLGQPTSPEELEPAALGLGAPGSRAALLATQGPLEWIGVEAPGSAPGTARHLARRLERQGRLAVVAALDPAARLLALTIGFGERPLLVIPLGEPRPRELRCLARIAGTAEEGPGGTAARIHEALDADAVGRRFYRAFRDTLYAMIRALPSRIPIRDRHALSLLQMTRVLFLYFVQDRGWLDGRPRYLREELDRCLRAGQPVHDTLLQPLFFGTLNQPVSSRRSGTSCPGTIPFLNGGLFEPHLLERRWRVRLPDAVWRSAFDDLYERFHFAPGDDDPEVIAPDMLGRVFEGVMSPEERATSGTFYTPASIVRDLLRQGLASLVSLRLGIGLSAAERRVADPDPDVRARLTGVTVLDPACGSGAFLLGALELLAEISGGTAFEVRQQIMARSLFGVDLNPAAVRLTELRLWLALIEANHEPDPARIRPLPNLDGCIRQGDSLLDPLPSRSAIGRSGPRGGRMHQLRHQLQEARGADKTRIIGQLRAEERKALGRMLDEARDRTSALIADLETSASSPSLFGNRQGLTRQGASRLTALRNQRRFVLRLRRRLDRDGTLPWFDFRTQFPDVFADRGGFDMVVGNPPWVRAEAIPPADRSTLAGRYRWWAPRRNRTSGYSHQPDLSVAFLERAFELAAPGGVVAFLVPAKLATTAYGETARAALAGDTTLYSVADLSNDPRAVFEATTYPMALVAGNCPPSRQSLVRCRLGPGSDEDAVPQSQFSAASWTLGGPTLHGALSRARGDHPVLSTRFAPQLGVKSGLNRVFLDPPSPIEPELLGWALRGRDIRAFTVNPRTRLLWTHGPDGTPLARLPTHAARWVEQHRHHLVRRADYRAGPPWILFRVEPAVAPCRVVWADLAPRLEAVALLNRNGRPLIPMNTCYVIPLADPQTALCLTAWLNSTWIRALAAGAADPASGGHRRFNARAVAGVPLPAGVLGDEHLARLARRAAEGSWRQEELDIACNRHLGLAPEDRQVLSALVPSRGRTLG